VKFSYCTKFGCQKPGALQYKNFTIPSSCNASNNQIKMQRSNWQQAQLLGVLSCTMTLHTKANYPTHQVIYIIYPTKLCNNYPQQIMLPHQYSNEEETICHLSSYPTNNQSNRQIYLAAVVHNENKGIRRDGEQNWILSDMKTKKALGTLLGLLGSLPAFLFLPLAAGFSAPLLFTTNLQDNRPKKVKTAL
jgi:hypothetical protein